MKKNFSVFFLVTLKHCRVDIHQVNPSEVNILSGQCQRTSTVLAEEILAPTGISTASLTSDVYKLCHNHLGPT